MVKALVSREQFENLKGKLKAEEGLDLAADKGTVKAKGVTADYEYLATGALSQLQISVTHHPWEVSTRYCEAQIADALQQAGVTAEVVG